jgi:hypothetical protein
MRVGDLVKYDCGRKKMANPNTVVGVIIERVRDADPEYFAWHVHGPGGTQAVHENFLEVVSESR